MYFHPTINNTKFLFIPDNYAHGFLTLEDDTIVTYLVSGEYNPTSEHSIVWDTIPNVKKVIAVDKKYFRPAEVESLLGDASKAKRKLGWEPKISFDQLIEDMVLYGQ